MFQIFNLKIEDGSQFYKQQNTRQRMKLFKFTLLTLIPALAVAQTTCADNAAFRFNHDLNDELMGCDWLTKDNAEDRKAKYYARGPIKGACLASCDFCACEDSSSFTFDLDNGNKQQDCKWFGLNNTYKRRAIDLLQRWQQR